MRYEIGDKVKCWGSEGVIKDKNPATRKYLVFLTKDGSERETPIAVYESELTKVEDSDD